MIVLAVLVLALSAVPARAQPSFCAGQYKEDYAVRWRLDAAAWTQSCDTGATAQEVLSAAQTIYMKACAERYQPSVASGELVPGTVTGYCAQGTMGESYLRAHVKNPPPLPGTPEAAKSAPVEAATPPETASAPAAPRPPLNAGTRFYNRVRAKNSIIKGGSLKLPPQLPPTWEYHLHSGQCVVAYVSAESPDALCLTSITGLPRDEGRTYPKSMLDRGCTGKKARIEFTWGPWGGRHAMPAKFSQAHVDEVFELAATLLAGCPRP